jgi:hypothetical protein
MTLALSVDKIADSIHCKILLVDGSSPGSEIAPPTIQADSAKASNNEAGRATLLRSQHIGLFGDTIFGFMRLAFALFALLATISLHWFDVYQKQQMNRFFHTVYVQGEPHVDVDLDGLEKARPKLEAYEIAMLLNAPSGAFFFPIEVATVTAAARFHDRSAFHERILWEFGLFGILVWYAAGKFIGDVRLACVRHPDIDLRWYDWTFSALCLVSGFILASIGSEPDDFRVHISYAYSGFAWLLLGAISLVFRFFQWRILRQAQS